MKSETSEPMNAPDQPAEEAPTATGDASIASARNNAQTESAVTEAEPIIKPAQTKREYSPLQKGQCLAFLDFLGGNVRKAAKLLGLPPQTLREWKLQRESNPELQLIGSVPAPVAKAIIKQRSARGELAIEVESGVRDLIRRSKKSAGKHNLKELWSAIEIGVNLVGKLKQVPTPTEGDGKLVSESRRYHNLVNRMMKSAKDRGKEVTKKQVIERLIQRNPKVAEYFTAELEAIKAEELGSIG